MIMRPCYLCAKGLLPREGQFITMAGTRIVFVCKDESQCNERSPQRFQPQAITKPQGRPDNRKAVVTVEAAIIMPLMLLLIVGSIDLWRLTYNQASVSTMADSGARYGSMGIQYAYDSGSIANAALLNNATDSPPSIASSTQTRANQYGTVDTYVTCSASAPFNWSIPIPAITINAQRTYIVFQHKKPTPTTP